jgi:hypothetical protein
MISARCIASATPGNGMTLPGIDSCGSAMNASSVLSSQVTSAFFIAAL